MLTVWHHSTREKGKGSSGGAKKGGGKVKAEADMVKPEPLAKDQAA